MASVKAKRATGASPTYMLRVIDLGRNSAIGRLDGPLWYWIIEAGLQGRQP